ncbi:MAG TPA: PEGA domain-containing protein [Ignavibacteriales bacterium]|nr:PEGA domain-containing protein [Ignavibacteriales bacterium]
MARVINFIFWFSVCSFTLVNSGLYCQSNPAEVNQLLITSQPEGAAVYINDKYCGNTPYIKDNAGNELTKITVTLNNVTRVKTFASVKGIHKLSFIMDGDYGILNFITAPEGASVFIDDSLHGQTPLSGIKFPQGSYKVTIKKDDYDVIERRFDIYTMEYDYNIKMEKKYGFVSVNNQETAPFLIDGSIAKKDENNEYKIEKGKRSFNIKPAEFRRAISESFVIEGGSHYELNTRYNYFTPKYLLYSSVIPGLGQILDKSEIKGCAYLLGTALCTTAYILANSSHKDRYSEFEDYREKYNASLNETDALKYRTLMEGKVSELNRLSRLKGIYLSASLGIYLLNIADAVIFHLNGSDLELRKVIDIDTQNSRLGLKIKLN